MTDEGDAFASRPTTPREELRMHQGVFLVLRAFFAQFWTLQFYSKAHAANGTFSLENLANWSRGLTADFVKSTPLPEFMVVPYTRTAPFIELTLGLLLAIGFKTRWVLLFAAAFLVSLDLGLMLKADHDTVKSNTIILLGLLWAADWARWDVLSVDWWLARPKR